MQTGFYMVTFSLPPEMPSHITELTKIVNLECHFSCHKLQQFLLFTDSSYMLDSSLYPLWGFVKLPLASPKESYKDCSPVLFVVPYDLCLLLQLYTFIPPTNTAWGPVVEKNKLDSILDLFLIPNSNPCVLLPVLSHAGPAPFVKECYLKPETTEWPHSQGSNL